MNDDVVRAYAVLLRTFSLPASPAVHALVASLGAVELAERCARGLPAEVRPCAREVDPASLSATVDHDMRLIDSVRRG